jgi:hypothetical protein
MVRRRAPRLLASALSGLMAAGSTPLTLAVAHADDPIKVVVLPFRVLEAAPVSEALAPKTTDIVADEFHNNDSVLLVTYKAPAAAPAAAAAKAAPAPATDEPAGSGAQALVNIEKGKAMVKAFKFKPAADALETAIGDYESFPATVDIKTLREAYLQLALAQLRSGDNDGGMGSLANAVRLAPDQSVGPAYPPPFRRAFDQAKHKVLASAKASVAVKGEGQVELDGKDLGAAPTAANNVMVGSHFMRVRRADGSVWGLKLLVGEGDNSVTIPEPGAKRPALVEAPVAPVAATQGQFGGLAQNRIDDALQAEVASAAKDAGADYVLFGAIYKAGENVGLATHLYSVRAHGEVPLHVVSFDTDLVSAGIEANKLATQTVQVAKAFPKPEALPAPVAPDVTAKPLVVAVKDPKSDPKPNPDDHKPIVVRTHTDTPDVPKVDDKPKVDKPVDKPLVVAVKPDDKPKTDRPLVVAHPTTTDHTLDANPVDVNHDPVGDLKGHTEPKPVDDGSSNLWIWGVVGGAAAVVAAGTLTGVLVYKNRSTPVTGSASISFQ